MNRRVFVFFCLLLTVLLLTVSQIAAQQAGKTPRIGFLYTFAPSSVAARTEAFRQGLRELGYVEGRNIVIEWRYAEGNRDRLPALASELVRLGVDVIVASGPSPTRSAKEATVAIPIVMARDTDPVRNGFVASLGRPGGNITGLSILAPEISGKQVELLNEILPRLSRVAVLGTSTSLGWAQILKETEIAAGALGVKLQYLDVLSPKDVETAFQQASRGRANAVLVLGSPIYASHRKQVADVAVKSRLPTIYRNSQYVEAGWLIAYGVRLTDLDRRAATYIDKILKGTKPADLPVEQPTRFEMVINLKTAKQLGITIPPTLLLQATKVIK